MELRVPPDVVALAVGALMWVVANLTPDVALDRWIRMPLGFVLIVAGLTLVVAARVAFARAATTFSPRSPGQSDALVTTGVFRFTRNPMYLGTLLILLGFGVALSNVWALGVSASFVIYIDRFQIAPEERVLADRFGKEFQAYVNRVRRWI